MVGCCRLYRLREQARSHKEFPVLTDFVYTKEPCGSGLAREEAIFNNTKLKR
jgi:hypothetical protein